MAIYPAEFGLSPLACAEDCITTCRSQRGGYLGLVPIYPGDPEAYGRCLFDCQSRCPGGAPAYEPGLCSQDIACSWGPAGQVIATVGGVVQDVAAIATPGTLPNVLALGALAVAGYFFVRAATS